MIKALVGALRQDKGRGFIDRPLPASVKKASAAPLLIGAAAPPPSASVGSPLVGPKWQSATNSCLGMSAAQAFRLSCLHKGIACPDLSGLFPYKLGRASMGLEDEDIGMSFEAMATAVERFGIASEESWPFSLLRANARPSGTALHDAYDRRGLRGYYAIDRSDSQGVRLALAKGYAVVGAWAVDRMFGVDSGPRLIDKPDRDIAGNHSMVVEDYAPDGSFGILNHYGDSWRDGGRCRFTEDYMKASLGYLIFDVGSSL